MASLGRLEAREFQLEGSIEDLVRVKQELDQANYDPFTGLANRVITRDRLHQGLLQTHSGSRRHRRRTNCQRRQCVLRCRAWRAQRLPGWHIGEAGLIF